MNLGDTMPRFSFKHSFVEIDREVLRSNARILQRNLKPDVRTMAVVKADAYGHDAGIVAAALGDLYSAFAVANVDEAIMLREAGITHPIMVFGVPWPETADAYVAYDLIAVVSAADHFDILKPGTRYHVEVDSGMGRLGFLPDSLEFLRDTLKRRSHLYCEGVMTHFATADETDSGHLKQQKSILKELRSCFGSELTIHAANSAASLDHPDTHADMVRHGIALYGYDPTPEPSAEFIPAMRWKSSVAQCKPVKKGMSLSYGATWAAPVDGWYAVIPCGYADGYRRNLSGRVPVLIGGKWYPQVGTVTMDYLMVWLGSDRYDTGTEVMVMGGACNHAGVMADTIDTIPYEICCGIHPKIPRVPV